MTLSELMMSVPMIALLAGAAFLDLRTRRISNLCTFSLLAGGLLQSFMPIHTVGPLQSVMGFLVGFGLQLIPFTLGALGGGDVKLLAGLGAWMGVPGIIAVFLVEKVIGLLVVLSQALWQGRMWVLLRNSAVLTLSVVHVKQLGIQHLRDSGSSSRSVDRPLPYAVPVLLAALIVLYYAAFARHI